MGHDANGSNGHHNGTNGNGNGHAPKRSLELKRGGFIASYPPFESLPPSGADAAWQKPNFGLYVHLPYCRKRCTFCFYKVYTNRNAKPMDRYLEAVFKEIDSYGKRGELRDRPVQTIYFGGGTPTTLSVEELRELAARLRANFNISPDVEWTSESEPGTLTEEKVATLREIGVTRLSMGVQTMDDDLLHKNGRSHNSDGVYKALGWARDNKFPVVNLDLMSGILDETLETWDASLQKFIDLGIEHISIYRMEVYKNTLLYAAGYTGPGVGGIPTNDEELEIWLHAVDKLEGAGYMQTSGHSFVKRIEDEHVQRLDMWGNAGELLGMGVSSYSYLNDTVFQNTSDWGTYVGKVMNGESPVGRGLRLNSRQKMAREFVLGLKLLRVDRPAFRHKHGFDILDLWGPQVEALANDGLLDVTQDAITLTRKARPYADVVCSVFYLPEHAEWKFHRFATEEELARAAILDLGQAPLNGSLSHRLPLSDELLLSR
jgi:oxygen-independent coproporphyrinogen-3 oxidase